MYAINKSNGKIAEPTHSPDQKGRCLFPQWFGGWLVM